MAAWLGHVAIRILRYTLHVSDVRVAVVGIVAGKTAAGPGVAPQTFESSTQHYWDHVWLLQLIIART